MTTVAIDFETYYRKTLQKCKKRPEKLLGIDINTLGTWHYLRHPEVNIYMLSVYDGSEGWVGDPKDFNWDALKGNRIVAHNISFDWQVVMRLQELGIAPKIIGEVETACTMDLVAYMAAPRSLKEAAQSLLDMKISKNVRDRMSGKRYEDLPENEKEEVRQYALTDAKTCWTLWDKFNDRWPETERLVSKINREATFRGMRVDMERVNQGIPILQEVMEKAIACIPWGSEGTPLSMPALRSYCNSQGIKTPESIAEDDEDFEEWFEEYGVRFPVVGHMRTWRKANTVLKKMMVLKERTRCDGRYQVELKYGAAEATLRFGGAAQLNIHNLAKDAIHGVDVRACLLPEEGHLLLSEDFKAIEPRVTAWITGNDALLAALTAGLDPYEAQALADGTFTGVPGTLEKVNPDLRQLKKAEILGLTYGLGNAEKFVRVAKKMANLEITVSESARVIDNFKKRNPALVSIWKELMQKFKASVRGDFEMCLPSGRHIRYGKVNGSDWSYEKVFNKASSRRRAWHGLLIENCLGSTTIVLTKAGDKCITEVTSDDEVWDGSEWVSTGGCVFNGEQEVGVWLGVKLTSEHLILAGKSFLPVMEMGNRTVFLALARGLNSGILRFRFRVKERVRKLFVAASAARIPWWLPDIFNVRRMATNVGSARMPQWPYAGMCSTHYSPQKNSLNDGSSDGGLRSLGVISPTVSRTVIMARGELECASNGLTTLNLFIGTWLHFLGGIRTAWTWIVSIMMGTMSLGIFVWLRVATIITTAVLSLRLISRERKFRLVSFRGLQEFRVPRFITQFREGSQGKLLWKSTGVEKVYDLVNCGPNHRFAIRTTLGEVIVHNCSQAIARDCLVESIVRLHKEMPHVPQHFSVHDSIVCSVKSEEEAKEVSRLMSITPDWSPGLPLALSGKLSERYQK